MMNNPRANSPDHKILPHVVANNFLFFNSDFCPLGQRGWLTLLEKQVNFKYIEVNCFNPTSEETQLFWEVSPHHRVPAGIYHGKNVYESMPFCKYVDEMFPENPLCPTAPYQRWKARLLIQEVNEQYVPMFYKVLFEKDPNRWELNKNNMTKVLKFFDDELEHSGGPWLLGEQFTVVDIALLPFVERTHLLLPYYRNWDPIQNFQNLKKWMQAGFGRDSFKITVAERTNESLSCHPYKATKREEYLREVFEAGTLTTSVEELALFLGDRYKQEFTTTTHQWTTSKQRRLI